MVMRPAVLECVIWLAPQWLSTASRPPHVLRRDIGASCIMLILLSIRSIASRLVQGWCAAVAWWGPLPASTPPVIVSGSNEEAVHRRRGGAYANAYAAISVVVLCRHGGVVFLVLWWGPWVWVG